VEYLNLSKNRLGVGAGVALGPAISENSSLQALDLSWNSIRCKGATAIGQGLKVITVVVPAYHNDHFRNNFENNVFFNIIWFQFA